MNVHTITADSRFTIDTDRNTQKWAFRQKTVSFQVVTEKLIKVTVMTKSKPVQTERLSTYFYSARTQPFNTELFRTPVKWQHILSCAGVIISDTIKEQQENPTEVNEKSQFQ